MSSVDDFENTLAWVTRHAEAMGISRLANITGLDIIGVPVAVAVRPASRSLAVAQGKGLTICAAKISALMEAAETFHAERIEQPLLFASQDELGQSVAANLKLFPALAGFNPEAGSRILWMRGWEIISEKQIWVPYDLVSTAYTVEMTENYSGLYASTTGLAAGRTIAAAMDHGLREVIERDAALLHHLSNEAIRDARRVRLSSVLDPISSELLRRFDHSGMFVAIWDITSDVNIPSFFSVVAPRHDYCSDKPFFAGGVGCSPCKEQALVAALTEAAQSRLTFISGAREDIERGHYDTEINKRFQAEYDVLLASEGGRSFNAIQSQSNLSLEDRLHLMGTNLASCGLRQIIVVNLTRADIAIPVVKMIVPGMEVALDVVGNTPGSAMTRRDTLQ